MPLYFAFGSNLDETQMARRCPDARAVVPAVLHEHRLSFRGPSRKRGAGVCTLDPAPGHRVRGLLYEVTDDHLAALDRFEGAPEWYRRARVEVRCAANRRHAAVTYRLPERVSLMAPTRAYYRQVAAARRLLGYPEPELRAALELSGGEPVVAMDLPTPLPAGLARLGEHRVGAVQRLLERCEGYHLLVDGHPAAPGAAQRVLTEVPPGRELDDKLVVGVDGADGELLAVVDLFRGYPDPVTWWISLLLVAPAARGRGLGARVYGQVEAWLRRCGARAVQLGVHPANPRAQGFWCARGFRPARVAPGSGIQVLAKSLERVDAAGE